MKTPLHVTVYLPLFPRDLWGPPNRGDAVLPFSAPRAWYYFLARNAIYHGVDLLGLRPGDEVLMPAYHHGIEVETLVAKGLGLRFYGVDEAMDVNPDEVRSALRPATRALYAIHYLGFPSPIAALRDIAKGAGIPLIEDCALALYSNSPDGPCGSFGDIGVFNLYKSLPTPHGGMLVANREDLPAPPPTVEPGSLSTGAYVVNRLLDGLMMSGWPGGPAAAEAARAIARRLKHGVRAETLPIDTGDLDLGVIDFGVRQVTRDIVRRAGPERIRRIRRENYSRMLERLRDGCRVVRPELPDGVCPLSFPIFVRDKEAVYERLLAEGVESVNMWSRRRPQVPEGAFPATEFLRKHCLELPIHQGVKPGHVDFIAERALRHARW